MADQEQLCILKQGVKIWNTWRKEHPSIEPKLAEADLQGIDLSDVNLRGADLSSANLSGVDLSGADLSDANISSAYLVRTDLSSANLRRANFGNSDLFYANLSQAICDDCLLTTTRCTFATFRNAGLRNASFCNSSLRYADFSGATLRETNFEGSDLREANFKEADLRGANFTRATLVHTDLSHADLSNSLIHGISAYNVALEGARQENLVITPPDEPAISVDNFASAQYVYLLLEHKKSCDTFDAAIERGVLLLGRFSDGGLELLQAVAAKLREMQYLPMIFNFDKQNSHISIETIRTLVGLSRFVIVDLSGPSVPRELYAIIPYFRRPFVPIMQKREETLPMFTALLEYSWVLSPIRFVNKEQLIEFLPSKVIAPAEGKLKESNENTHGRLPSVQYMR